MNTARPPRKRKWRDPHEPEYDEWGRRIRLRHPPELKERLVEEQGGLCHWCSRPFGQVPDGEEDTRPAAWLATYEHVIRFEDGGLDGPPNLVAAHRKCNEDRDKSRNGASVPMNKEQDMADDEKREPRQPTEEDIKAATEALLRLLYGPVLKEGQAVNVSIPESISFAQAAEAVARSHIEGRDYRPAAIVEQACMISKHGKTVTIECDDHDEAQEMFDWLIDDEPEGDSRT